MYHIDSGTVQFFHHGKVRTTYTIRDFDNLLLLVAGDGISTHNVVHESEIPCKGEVLTALTIYWLTKELKEFPNHLVASGEAIYDFVPELAGGDLHYRAIVVQRLSMISVEFIFRSYLTGSLKKAYDKGKDPYGLSLPPGLVEMSKFETPIFTPTEKSDTDPPLLTASVKEAYPEASEMAWLAYETVSSRLAERRIALVDTKLEIGLHDGEVCLADEVFTPDSSRFVNEVHIEEGVSPPWLDKQLARDEAERIWADGGNIPLNFSQETIDGLQETYDLMLEWITDSTLADWKLAGKFDFLKG